MGISIKLGALALAVTPFVWSVVIHSGAAPTPMSISVPKLPALSFRQYAVDLGKIQPTSESRATFVFFNRGAGPVEITKVVPSCSCLVPRVDQKVFEPGENGRIILRIQPANEAPGRKELFADVWYNDPEPRQVRLTFKLDIPDRQMSVTPAQMMIFHPAGSTETVATFTVTDGRKKPFELTDVAANTELVTPVIGERTVAPTGEWSQTVQVTIPGAIPPGKHHALLRIKTTDPDYAELRVPMLLQGPHTNTAGDEDHEHVHTQSLRKP
ncbi:MAG: DUF1573 domain-containing protein [Planctomycetes bacterium]|nr:DUF1573 domain-containing protein [Planctomycetota bacterium]